MLKKKKKDFTFIPYGNHQKHVSLLFSNFFIFLLVSGCFCFVFIFFNFFFLLVSSCGYRYDSKAFLFSLVNKPGWAPVKLTQTGQYSYNRARSTYSCSSYEPTFGGGYDIHASNYASSNKNSYTNLGYTYAPPSGYSFGSTFTQTFLAGTYNFQPDEVETFYETT